MERISGLIPADHPPYPLKGWLHDATPAQQAQVFDGGLVAMANLHALDWRGLGLGFLDRTEYGPAGIGRQVAMTGPLFDWVLDGRTMPLLDDAWAWLQANVPDDPRVVLNWGDSRLGNIMYRDSSRYAILDWEMVTVGPGDLELAWWLVFTTTTHSRNLPDLPGFPSDDEAIADEAARRAGALRLYLSSRRSAVLPFPARHDGRARRARSASDKPRPRRLRRARRLMEGSGGVLGDGTRSDSTRMMQR
jgi:aminoglycoside phosphotransferase (APT) family kinase protein